MRRSGVRRRRELCTVPAVFETRPIAYRWYKSTKDDVIEAYERPVAMYLAAPVAIPFEK